MHELSLIENMLDQLDAMKRQHNLREITDVYLTVGELSGVDLRFLQSSFDLYAPSTAWAHLKMHLTQEPWRVRCRDCGLEQQVEEWNNQCGRCTSPNTETIQGTEFLIQRIEGEPNV
jgi:hydrogenase nickel incorporation protein HypA/HybF